MTKMTIYTKGTFKIVENPAIVDKFLLTEQSAIVRFYCISNIIAAPDFVPDLTNVCSQS